MARSWNPAYHPRGPNGRFTRSATRKMTPADRNRGRKAMEGFNAARFADAGAARDYLEKAGPAQHGGAVATYLDDGWRETNPALRAGKTPEGVDEIDAAMRPLPDDVMLRRQVPLSLFAHIPMQDLMGMKVRDAAYASTSLDVPGHEPGGADTVTMHIAAPKGTPAIVNAADGEILLARDTEVAVTRVEPNGRGGWDLYGAVLPKARKRIPKSDLTPAPPADEKPDGGATEPPGKQDTPPAKPKRAARKSKAAPRAPSFTDRLGAASSGADALTAAPTGAYRSAGDLTSAEAFALKTYRDDQATYFEDINGALRGTHPRPQAIRQLIGDMDTAMSKSPVTGDVVVHRGIRDGTMMFGDRMQGDLTGMRWREDGFVSTTADPDATYQFTDGPNPLQMRILAPAGARAVDLMDPDYPDEAELLIDRGHELVVVADRGVVGGVRQVDVEVQPKVGSDD